MIYTQRFTTLLMALAAGACTTAPSHVESRFGQSARLLVDSQTAAQADAPALDGQLGAEVLAVYRSDVAKPEKVENNIVFNIGK